MVFKNRYMVMEVFMNPNRDQAAGDSIIITQFNVSNAIKDSILVNFGECGLAASLGSFQVKYVNPITNMCIIRASREEYEKVWASITMLRSIGHYPVVFNLLDLSGNLQATKTAALKCEKAKFEQYKLMVGDRLSADDTHRMNNYLAKIEVLEH
ncbi:probable ribonuclease P/MRP protein subunit POP5 [Trifolium pratense]|uniref:probable ribonuclease P/MRP protein subunit POP5 n=1 Tax=Trifolium pratense TaxID=57577 RepID=UPI001E692038|nr:probable ribonuclease P/MRP protein subunit POP5 [Trifolium pratense]